MDEIGAMLKRESNPKHGVQWHVSWRGNDGLVFTWRRTRPGEKQPVELDDDKKNEIAAAIRKANEAK